jgi:ATP-dependent Lon protease
MTVSIDLEREASVLAASLAAKGDHLVFVCMQKHPEDPSPSVEGLYPIGTVCRVKQMLRQMQQSYSRLIVEGLYRAEMIGAEMKDGCFQAQVAPRPDRKERVSEVRKEAIIRSCLNEFHEYLDLAHEAPGAQLLQFLTQPNEDALAFFIAQNIAVSPDEKQEVLNCDYPIRRFQILSRLMKNEIQILQIEKELSAQAQDQMIENQREYFLREELRAIQAELGEEDLVDDFSDYAERIAALNCSEEVREKLGKELGRLRKQPFGSSEAAVLRNYLDVCLELPWGVKTQEIEDLALARKMLDEDHYGLEKVKERVLEYLAVHVLAPDVKGGMLCLVGPPGTGKTSIAMSVARATGRKLVRVSLGGIHDEAEIRGHRKTYIGSMPGRIINGVIQAKSCNPLMVLDEIDKITLESVSIDGLTKNYEEDIDLTQITLPGNVTLTDETTDIKVKAVIEKLDNYKVDFKKKDIRVEGGDGYTVTYDEDNEYVITVYGTKTTVSKLKGKDFDPWINVEGLEAGSHDMTVHVKEVEGVSIQETPTIGITLKAR